MPDTESFSVSGLVVPTRESNALVPTEFWQPCPGSPKFEHGQVPPLPSPKQ